MNLIHPSIHPLLVVSKKSSKLFLFSLIFSFSFFLFVHSASAATYYVSVADGNDTNCTGLAQTAYVSGSAQSCPWKTLSKVRSISFNAGDSIFFKKGETFTGYLSFTTNGASGNVITYSAYGTGTNPIIDGTGSLRALYVNNNSYITIDSIDIKNGTNYTVQFYGGATGITISNSTITGASTAGGIGTTDSNTYSSIILDNLFITVASNKTAIQLGGSNNLGWIINNISVSGANYGLYSSGGNTQIAISSSTITGCVSAGLSIVNSSSFNALNSIITNNGGNGVVLSGTLSNITLTNIVATGNNLTNTSISATGNASNVTITRGTFSSSVTAYGLSISSGGGTVSAVSISDLTANYNAGHGIYLSNVSDLTINNITANNNGVNGILHLGTANNETLTTIITNENTGGSGIYYNISSGGTISITGAIANQNYSDGISFNASGVANAATVSNSTAYANGNDGMDVAGTWTNIIWDHDTVDTNGTDGIGADGDGFSFHDSSTGIIRYSVAKNNLKSSVAHVNSSQVLMHDNLFQHDSAPTLAAVYVSGTGEHTLYNNTIYCNYTSVSCVSTSAITTIKNNIIYGGSYGVNKFGGAVTEDYNLVYGAGTSNYNGLIAGTHSITSDPKFTSSSDFHLLSNSPAINAGVDVGLTSDYEGLSIHGLPDIGAYEYQPAVVEEVVTNSSSNMGGHRQNISHLLAPIGTTKLPAESVNISTTTQLSIDNKQQLQTLILDLQKQLVALLMQLMEMMKK